MEEIAVFDVVSLRENAVGRFYTARETLKYVRSSSRQRFRRHERKTGNRTVWFNDDFVIVVNKASPEQRNSHSHSGSA